MAVHDNPVIKLTPNSLFVTVLPTLDDIHWAIFITDINGIATRHHWSEVDRATSDLTSPAEHYSFSYVDPVCVYTREKHVHLGFFKVAGYTGPRQGVNIVEKFRSIFPASFVSSIQNRRHNINSYTWCMKALTLLQESNVIERSDQVAQCVERVVSAKITDMERILRQSNLVHRPYVSYVADIK